MQTGKCDEKRGFMKKVLMVMITCIIICLSIWFQMGFLNAIPLSGVNANFGIVLVVGLGFISGNFIGGLVGGVYGFLMDIAFGRAIGIYTSLYMLVGIVAGCLNKGFSKGNKISMIMLILLCTVIFEVLTYFINIILNNFEIDLKTLLVNLILESAYNILLTILFFNPIAFWGDILNKSKNSYYML